MAFSWHFWPFQAAIPASFSSDVVRYIYNTRGTFRQVPTRRIRLFFVKRAYSDLRDIYFFFIILEVYNGFRYRKGWHQTSKQQLWHTLGCHFY